MLIMRPGGERGHADHGWLESWHSFSFGDYHDPQHMHFGPLRVLNEDRVHAGGGFAPHNHADMEILSYVLEGALEHKDSLGNGSTIRPGDVQRMSAGRGVQHSEFNASAVADVHFLQIWIVPDVRGIAPEYEQRHVSEAARRGQLCLIASADGAAGSLRIHQDARIYAALVTGAESPRLALDRGRLAYVQLARGTLAVNGQPLQAGDGVMLRDEASVTLSGARNADVLVLDLPAEH